MRPYRPAWIIATALVGLASVAPSGATTDETPATVRLEAMRDLARGVALVDPRTGAKADLIPEPIYRFDDPARAFGDGSIWAFGTVGRPAALLCLSLTKWNPARPTWMHEFTALADGPVAASSQHPSGPWTWAAPGSGIAWQAVPQALAPGETEARRLVQIKELARRFKAFEAEKQEGRDPSDRFELRLLPQPIHRYRDPDHGLLDGAIFLLSYGRNPEIALLIEARRAGKGTPTWSYALARLAAARLHVSFDDREVADLAVPPDLGPTRPYFLIHRPATGLKD